MQTVDISETTSQTKGLKAFVLTLRPRRSADPRVAYGFCGVLGVVWFAAGVFFTTLGGWPIIGFFGAEFILIAGMIHIFLRRTDVVETVEITPQTVHVKRRDLRGEEECDFAAYWAQVDFSGSPTENSALEIRSHGNAVEIGRFLSAAEKARIADKLRTVLHSVRSAIPPQNTAN